MALAKVLVVRLISMSVRRWRETTFVVRWSARTFVRHVAPAAAASLTSLSISAPAFFGAFFGAASFAAAAAGRVGGQRCHKAVSTWRYVLTTTTVLSMKRGGSRSGSGGRSVVNTGGILVVCRGCACGHIITVDCNGSSATASAFTTWRGGRRGREIRFDPF